MQTNRNTKPNQSIHVTPFTMALIYSKKKKKYIIKLYSLCLYDFAKLLLVKENPLQCSRLDFYVGVKQHHKTIFGISHLQEINNFETTIWWVMNYVLDRTLFFETSEHMPFKINFSHTVAYI